ISASPSRPVPAPAPNRSHSRRLQPNWRCFMKSPPCNPGSVLIITRRASLSCFFLSGKPSQSLCPPAPLSPEAGARGFPNGLAFPAAKFLLAIAALPRHDGLSAGGPYACMLAFLWELMPGPESTCWTVIHAAAAGAAADREQFAQRYGPVVRAYLAA